MNTLTMPPQDDLDDPSNAPLPGRPRHRLLNRVTMPLLALLIAAGGFLGGVEVERGHGGVATATSSAAGFGRGFARSGAGAAGGRSFGGAPGAAGAAGGETIGTISSISGRTLYLKETSGTTIKVTLTSATSLKKELAVSRNSIRPGDTVTVQGISGSGGSIKASSVSDAGHSATSSASSSG